MRHVLEALPWPMHRLLEIVGDVPLIGWTTLMVALGIALIPGLWGSLGRQSVRSRGKSRRPAGAVYGLWEGRNGHGRGETAHTGAPVGVTPHGREHDKYQGER